MRAVPFLFLLCCLLNFVGCAKRGSIYGGPKDTIPPVFLSSDPRNLTTNFTGNEIVLYFDEYVKIKEANKQVIVSPPQKTRISITPGNATRKLTVRLNDTLLPNTTYSINFGNSIQDNNEGNPLQNFKYVFSTGDYIDTLTVVGKIKDALERKTDNFVNIMLYEANENFNDSLIYKQKPVYVTNTLDSLKVWSIDFVKTGKYYLYALKDKNNNYQYDPKTDKIGFLKEPIQLPTDTVYALDLFKEVLPMRPVKPVYEGKRKVLAGYEGNFEPVTIKGIYDNQELDLAVTRVASKDSLHVWIPTQIKDSLQLRIKDRTYSVRIKNDQADTLKVTAFGSGALSMRNHYSFNTNNPIAKIDPARFEVLQLPDSTQIPFTVVEKPNELNYQVQFAKQHDTRYAITVYPHALTDIFGFTNDTIRANFATKMAQDYCNLTVQINNYREGMQLIAQIVDESGRVKAEEIAQSALIELFNIEPTQAYLRIIVDENKNDKWDPGILLERRYSEPVYYHDKIIDLRANFDIFQPFTLP